MYSRTTTSGVPADYCQATGDRQTGHENKKPIRIMGFKWSRAGWTIIEYGGEAGIELPIS